VKLLWTATALRALQGVPRVIGAEILEKLESVAAFPEMHAVRSRGRYRGMRWFPVGPWLVYYRIERTRIMVCGIWHRARHDA
jgi:plasmid stabilization system protein ParE